MKIRSPRHLQDGLKSILAYCQSSSPSRVKLARKLGRLADDLMAQDEVASKGPYVEGPEPSEAEIRRMTKLGRGGEDATWAKLRDGSWGVRLTSVGSPGDQVTVRKKSGQTSKVTLGRLIWTDRSVWLFTVGTGGSSGSSGSSGSRSHSHGRWTGCSCGSIEDEPRDSDCASCRYDNQ
jgi:hypothetical protein